MLILHPSTLLFLILTCTANQTFRFPNLHSHRLFIAGKARRSALFKRKKKKKVFKRTLPSAVLLWRLKSWCVDRLCFCFHQWKEVRPDELMDSKLRCVFELPLENEKTVSTPFSSTLVFNSECCFSVRSSASSFHVTAARSVPLQRFSWIAFSIKWQCIIFMFSPKLYFESVIRTISWISVQLFMEAAAGHTATQI